MIEPNLAPAGTTATDANARVLVCSVDRGLFGIQAGWVEAVYPIASMTVHTTRTDAGQRQAFIVHRDEPALIVDLRQAIGLDGVLGDATRDAFLVLRSGPALLRRAIASVSRPGHRRRTPAGRWRAGRRGRT